MKSSRLKTFNVIFILTACVVISVAATKPSTSEIKSVQTLNSDTGNFKNLQVLPKNISKDSLDKIMHNFSASLGVHCNFCHVHPDFASDDKPEKGIARQMMRMTADINTKYFNFDNSTSPDTISVVKCVTCHRQNPHPDEVQMANMDEHHDHDHMMPPPGSNGNMPPNGVPPADSSKPHN